MTSAIVRLWRAGTLPIRSALHRADGSSRAVRPHASTGSLALLEPFDLDAWLSANPHWCTRVDTTAALPLPDGSGHLCCGETSYGSDGFFARTDSQGTLVWAVHLEHSNPFLDAAVDGPHATFRSTSGVSITVDLASPEFGPR